MNNIILDAPLPEGMNEKSFFVVSPRTLAALAPECADSLPSAKQVIEDLPSGTYWVLKVATVATTEEVPSRTRVRFTPTTTRARKPRPAGARRGRRSAAVRPE